MRLRLFGFAGLAALVVSAGCASHYTPSDFHSADRAQQFNGLSSHTRTVTTDSDEAQEYFNQGLNWMYAFNHDEAIRSFLRAAELDPDCAMAWWGVSVCHGPNYNDPIMTPERNAAAWTSLQEAIRRLDDETEAERDLIAALEARYDKQWREDRTDLEQAYADAMAEVWAAYPNDSDVGTLYAESLMVQMPWMLYSLGQEPAEDTPMILATLERVMAMDPGNPGANHLYIHAVEPSADPDRGLPAARRLNDMAPTSGHLLHMPSHLYVKTGHWDEAVSQNKKAMRSDDMYRAKSPDQTFQHMYMVHNAHMLAYAAMMSGREQEAMEAARSMWVDIPMEVQPMVAPYVDLWMCSVYDVQKRFGRWDALLAEEAPPAYFPITVAVWHAHRAIAYAALKDFSNAEAEYDLFVEAKNALPDDHIFGLDAAHRILDISDLFIQGEIALQQGRWSEAASLLEGAAAIEDELSYGEPPQWLQPVRHTLGAVYLKSGQYEQAERVYREDLAKWRDNGWSLYGLYRALEMQGYDEEAAAVRREYERIWAHADAPTQTSCKCIPTT